MGKIGPQSVLQGQGGQLRLGKRAFKVAESLLLVELCRLDVEGGTGSRAQSGLGSAQILFGLRSAQSWLL